MPFFRTVRVANVASPRRGSPKLPGQTASNGFVRVAPFESGVPSRTGIEHIRSGRIYFPQYFVKFFLNICIFLKKLNLSCKKSIPVGLPRHPAANKFLMDFAVAR